ncbi:hypothetical protein QYF61_008369 [Mycteria americana]|uniref:Uncharacterized protein n=1 Tax=Mycteria americana TaxID=33587 RepID=A0AAN7PYE2_MYCAM|nr:hypothetical protein QYF61_008369 [Mycteria americana]
MVADWLESSFGGRDVIILVDMELDESQQRTLAAKAVVGTLGCMRQSITSRFKGGGPSPFMQPRRDTCGVLRSVELPVMRMAWKKFIRKSYLSFTCPKS